MAFSFGAQPAADAPAAAPTPGFSFGGAATPSKTPLFGAAATAAAPAPAGGAFSFGAASAAPATLPTTPAAPAPAGGAFSFGGAAAAPAAMKWYHPPPGDVVDDESWTEDESSTRQLNGSSSASRVAGPNLSAASTTLFMLD